MTQVTITYDDAEWQLVPKKATREMRLSLLRSFDSERIWRAVLAAAPQPTPSIVHNADGPAITADVHRDAEQLQKFAEAVKIGIADHFADNAPMRKHSHAEIDVYIRSVEIRAEHIWASIAARAGEKS